jgi:hypothetical protein
LKLICTDRGTHGSAEVATVRVEDDGSFDVVPTRLGPAPWADVPGAQIVVGDERHLAPRKVLRKSESRRSDFEGRRRWRFSCPRCSRDVPFNEDTMRKIVEVKMAAAETVTDVSWLT